ncbi:MAG: hypothetical protein JO199_10420 [Candidatus Eremiobacteraeota bacterium]|nr:hypothetical protein [Candidatus Eremiobacteraeota bacterium]
MIYVEWQRILRTLKWTAIVMAAVTALMVVVNAWALYFVMSAPLNEIKFNGKTGAEIVRTNPAVHTVLPDGTQRTLVDDEKDGVRITIDDHGYWGKHIESFEAGHTQESEHMNFGPAEFTVTHVNGGTFTIFDSNKPEDFAWQAGFAGIVALMVATLLGAPFARENDGHLEVALTKPIARTALALQTVAIDLAGIVLSWAIAFFAMFLQHAVLQAPLYTFGAWDLAIVVAMFAGSFAWYALLNAATASLRRGYGAVLGFAWPAALAVMVMAKSNFGDSQLARTVHWIATPIAYLLPFNYLPSELAYTANGQPHGWLALQPYSEIPALVALVVVYVAIAVVQWRRVEA